MRKYRHENEITKVFFAIPINQVRCDKFQKFVSEPIMFSLKRAELGLPSSVYHKWIVTNSTQPNLNLK